MISEIRTELGESVYSNMDHDLDAGIEAKLADNLTIYAQHAAWNFCGHVWYDGELWHDEVWFYNMERETFSGDTAMSVIEQANDEYGNE